MLLSSYMQCNCKDSAGSEDCDEARGHHSSMICLTTRAVMRTPGNVQAFKRDFSSVIS